jgi:hypothetical protein
MEFSFESYLIALFGILPGFIPVLVRGLLSNDQEEMPLEKWVAISIITSMCFNAVVVTIFILFVLPIQLDTSTESFFAYLKDIKVVYLRDYGILLYALAVLWGVGTALKPKVLGTLVQRWRLTPISPIPNVFCDILERSFRTPKNLKLHGKPDQQVPWISITRERITIVGRLQRSSVRFDLDKPIEIYVSPAGIFTSSKVTAVEPPGGLYLRVLPTDVVELLSAPASANLVEPAAFR